MSLAVGTRLGPYEIQRQIGAGGMGEVYGATDPRLGRSVAIKVLPPALREHPDRLRRFEQEARTIGALNHPNLLTLHDVGQYDGAPYLVTELLEGQSLRQQLAGGALSPRAATRIAREVARGLAAAHTAGVVHRDIKPDNLFVTADARVKILDFGIAKLRDDDLTSTTDRPRGSDPALLATAMPATAGTGTGMIVGTPGYMAPEQLAGKAVDPRTDIFSLGVVLYELVAGKRPFAGETHVEESYAVLKSDPPALPLTVPAPLERIIMRCLEKRADERFQNASDLAFALESLENGEMSFNRAMTPAPGVPAVAAASPSATTAADLASAPTGIAAPAPTISVVGPPAVAPAATLPTLPTLSSGVVPAAASARPATSRRWPAIAAVAGVVAIAATGWAVHASRRAPAAAWPDRIAGGPMFRRITYRPRDQWYARFNANASAVVYSVRTGSTDEWKVYRSDIAHASVESVDVIGRVLSISSKDELALSTPWHEGVGGVLSRGFTGAGSPSHLAEGISDAVWAPDADHLAVVRADEHGVSIEYPMGTTIVHRASGTIPYLAVSPDGQHIAFCEVPGGREARGRVMIANLDGSETAASPAHATIRGLAWSPDGSEVWYSTPSGAPEDSAIHALSRDGRERVLLRTAASVTLLDVAKDGRMLVSLGDARTFMKVGPRNDKQVDLAWFDGSDVQSISPDGRVIAFVEASGTGQTVEGHAAYIRNAQDSPVLVGHASRIAIIPDGAEVNAVVELVGDKLRRVQIAQGTSTELNMGTVVKLDPTDRMSVSWAGRYLVVRGEDASKVKRLWLWDLTTSDPPQAVGPSPNTKGYHPLSGDGRWIALPHKDGGIDLVSTVGEATRSFPSPEPKLLVEPLSFTKDGLSLIVMAAHKYPRKIYHLDLIDIPTPWSEWTELDIPSKPTLFEPWFSADGDILAYSYSAEATDLYVIEPPPAR